MNIGGGFSRHTAHVRVAEDGWSDTSHLRRTEPMFRSDNSHGGEYYHTRVESGGLLAAFFRAAGRGRGS